MNFYNCKSLASKLFAHLTDINEIMFHKSKEIANGTEKSRLVFRSIEYKAERIK